MSKTTTYGVPSFALPDADANRRNLFLAALPVVFVLGICLTSLAQQHVKSEQSEGNLSQNEATTLADNVLTRLTGEPTEVLGASFQGVYSLRRHRSFHEWEITCESQQERYLVRINAETRQVYAINRLTAANLPDSENYLTKPQAEQLARRYLTTMGIPAYRLQRIRYEEDTPTTQPRGENEWNFSFHHKGKPATVSLVKASVDSRTGSLDTLWNPSNRL